MTPTPSTTLERWTDGRIGWQSALLVQACMTALLLLVAPTSLHADLMSDSGVVGDVVIGLFITAFIAAFVDLIVNDLLPDRFVITALHHLRPYAMLVLAVGYFFMATASSLDANVALGGLVVIGYYTLGGLGCIWWAFTYAYLRMHYAQKQ